MLNRLKKNTNSFYKTCWNKITFQNFFPPVWLQILQMKNCFLNSIISMKFQWASFVKSYMDLLFLFKAIPSSSAISFKPQNLSVNSYRQKD